MGYSRWASAIIESVDATEGCVTYLAVECCEVRVLVATRLQRTRASLGMSWMVVEKRTVISFSSRRVD